MARHYSTKSFFRQIPNALLASYFADRGLFGDLDFSAMKETKPDELFAAWLDLPEEQRKPLDAEFHDIFELSCKKGFRVIIDVARLQIQVSIYVVADHVTDPIKPEDEEVILVASDLGALPDEIIVEVVEVYMREAALSNHNGKCAGADCYESGF